MWSKARKCFEHRHYLSQLGTAPVVSGGYISDHKSCMSCTLEETRGRSSAIFFVF